MKFKTSVVLVKKNRKEKFGRTKDIQNILTDRIIDQILQNRLKHGDILFNGQGIIEISVLGYSGFYTKIDEVAVP